MALVPIPDPLSMQPNACCKKIGNNIKLNRENSRSTPKADRLIIRKMYKQSAEDDSTCTVKLYKNA
jgi:hypothetical protein